MALADVIERCAVGDIIIVYNDAMQELGERARARMCPDKSITFEIEQSCDLGFAR